jgi:hypothetical protein
MFTVAQHYRNVDTDMRRLTTGIRSEKCVVRRFHRCGNVIDSTYTNLYIIALYGIKGSRLGYRSQHVAEG